MKVEGSVVWVVGASRGIGRAAARAFAREGARVVLSARGETDLRALAEALAPAEVMVQPVDVTSDASVCEAARAIEARWGRIDVVLGVANNAEGLSRWVDTPSDFTRRMFDVHLFGFERLSRAVVPGMVDRGSGTLVAFASTVGWVPMPYASAYSSAKAAVIAFADTLDTELAPSGVRVLLFAPPHTDTDAGRRWPLDVQIFSPEQVAEELVASVQRERRSHLAGLSNRMLLGIQRLAPGWARAIMAGVGERAAARLTAVG